MCFYISVRLYIFCTQTIRKVTSQFKSQWQVTFQFFSQRDPHSTHSPYLTMTYSLHPSQLRLLPALLAVTLLIAAFTTPCFVAPPKRGMAWRRRGSFSRRVWAFFLEKTMAFGCSFGRSVRNLVREQRETECFFLISILDLTTTRFI